MEKNYAKTRKSVEKGQKYRRKSHFASKNGDFNTRFAFFSYLCRVMKQTTKYKLDQIRLYVCVTVLAYIILDKLMGELSAFVFPHSDIASYIADIAAFILSVVLVVRHVRCYPLTEEEKKAGLWFQIRLTR